MLPLLLASLRARLARLPLLPLLLSATLLIAFVISVYRASLPPSSSSALPSIFSSPLVSPAPAPSLPLNRSAHFDDSRGSYHRVVFPAESAQYENVIFSRAGAKRSGDLHLCAQLNLIVSGSAMLWTFVHGRVRKRRVEAGELVRTPGGMPHLFEFLEDTVLTEHWVHEDGLLCEFQAWYYEPFRKEVDAALNVTKGEATRGTGVVEVGNGEMTNARKAGDKGVA